MKIVGYLLSAHDNGSFYLDVEKPGDAPVCTKCGFLLSPVDYFNPFFKIKRKTLDFSFTYDNRPIVSLKFKEFCIRNNYKNISFKSFEREGEFFQFFVKKTLVVDVEKSKLTYENYCDECGKWQGIFFKEISIISNLLGFDDEFYKTDLLFSQGNRKGAQFIIGVETYKKLKIEKMKGLIYDPITSDKLSSL